MPLRERRRERPAAAFLNEVGRTAHRFLRVRGDWRSFEERSKPSAYRGFVGERGHHRQRLLSLPQIAEHRLAGYGRVAPDAQQIIDRLKGKTEMWA
jgi:hypothetical protein